MVCFMISIKENDHVSRLGIIGFLEAQFLEVIHEVDALCPVGVGAVECRYGVHARLWIYADSARIILLPRLREMDDVREVVIGMGASL